MNRFQKITEEAAWERCFEQFDWFHDSILREVYLVSKGYVTAEREMFDDTACDARLIFQSQDECISGLELVLKGVTEFRMANTVALEPSISLTEAGFELALGGEQMRSRSLIVANSAWYRLLRADVLGEQLRIGSLSYPEISPV